MNCRTRTAIALLLALWMNSALAAPSVRDCQATVAKFKDLGNVSELMQQAYGYAVLPTIGKGGIGIGGAAGRGCVFAGGEHSGNVGMGQITIGFQLGGQAYSQLILFRSVDIYEEFTRGNFEFGADATAVALTYGASATANTQGASVSAGDTQGVGMWKRGMAIFTLAKGGLMYEARIGGQKYDFKPID
ncbi:MAG: YSC84-related protein [Wenzhouxiangellaceae bacterium]|nr:YSC84-related protein [Wenzhouxiangellaceae bacterium]